MKITRITLAECSAREFYSLVNKVRKAENSVLSACLSLACRAHLDSDTVSAGSAVRRLVVDRLIAFGEAGGCDWQYQLSGVYESDDPRHRQGLRLRPDRTFLLTRFGDGTESHTTGSWGLASELVLLLDCEAGSRMSFQLIPDRQALLSDDRTLSFTKVYL